MKEGKASGGTLILIKKLAKLTIKILALKFNIKK